MLKAIALNPAYDNRDSLEEGYQLVRSSYHSPTELPIMLSVASGKTLLVPTNNQIPYMF